jgi:hypothetical protein
LSHQRKPTTLIFSKNFDIFLPISINARRFIDINRSQSINPQVIQFTQSKSIKHQKHSLSDDYGSLPSDLLASLKGEKEVKCFRASSALR